MKIPKSIDDLPECYAETRLGRFAANFNCIETIDDVCIRDGHFTAQRMQHYPDSQKSFLGNGRFVPDDILKARFAFAGEVKLTREEAILIQNVLWRQGETGLAQIIQSKLSAEEETE